MILTEPFERAWHHRELIRAVVRREFISRFRDTMLGWVWAIFAPLAMLLAYTTIFSVAAPMVAQGQSTVDYAAASFVGLILFNTFAELAARAPTLLHEHVYFIKRSIFPGETIAWTSVARALIYAAISFGTLIVVRLVTVHYLQWTILLAPLVLIPFTLFLLGMTWFLMALGAFTKDVSYLMVAVVPLMMFGTPVFFTIEQLPANLQPWAKLNLVGDFIAMMRDLVINGKLPSLPMYLACFVVSYAVFLLGYRFYNEYKSVIVDVI
ncbi:MAG: ABC transporter permease [Hyphomicrobiales bacterium]|nr:ABC transporter permease [Hyphomicrobiales bacterium]